MKTAKPILSPDMLRKIDAYWRAANYLSVGQIYLYDNPLLREPLKLEHVKPLESVMHFAGWRGTLSS
jgi:xylulose-5-phosphate/fructose-6-phosphate phosphoketolase